MQDVRELLDEIVRNSQADAILLSGGLDSSVLSLLASKHFKLKAFTVCTTKNSADHVLSKKIAKFLNLKHFIHFMKAKEVIKEIPPMIKILRSYDPTEIRNSIVLYLGIKEAHKKNIKTIICGDGADELFLGYNFLYHKTKDELEKYLDYLTKFASYRSIELAKAFKISIITPFLDKELLNYVKKMDLSSFIKKKNDTIYGKWILRKTFEKDLPSDVIWRAQTSIEHSSGSFLLKEYIDTVLPIEEFEEDKDDVYAMDNVELLNNEQYYYYKIYKRFFGPPYAENPQRKHCPYCKSDLPHTSLRYCPTCGTFPI